MIMDLNKIGKFIMTLRKEKGLTQEQLGTKLGVSGKSVSKWESSLRRRNQILFCPPVSAIGFHM